MVRFKIETGRNGQTCLRVDYSDQSLGVELRVQLRWGRMCPVTLREPGDRIFAASLYVLDKTACIQTTEPVANTDELEEVDC